MNQQENIQIDIRSSIESLAEVLSGNEKAFFLRVWGTDAEIYKNRLRAIGFTCINNVLDAGCGYGQWSACLASLNKTVYAIDNSEIRVNLVRQIAELLNIENLFTSIGSIENINFADAEFDAVFCYSVILFSDYKKVIKEFHRILKPGGKIYICANGLGWYLYNIISSYNSSSDFNSRQMGINAIENTFSYLRDGSMLPGEQLIIPGKVLVSELEKNNFSIYGYNGEGLYNIEKGNVITQFFKSEYLGAEGVYEVIAEKKF